MAKRLGTVKVASAITGALLVATGIIGYLLTADGKLNNLMGEVFGAGLFAIVFFILLLLID